jgi:hypothetical protein
MILHDINKIIKRQMIEEAKAGDGLRMAGQYEESADPVMKFLARAGSLGMSLIGNKEFSKDGISFEKIGDIPIVVDEEKPEIETKYEKPEDIKKTLDSTVQTVDLKESLTIEFNYECWAKIQYWVNMTSQEISGMGLVKRTDNGFEVYDVFLIEQKNTSAETDIDDMALIKLYEELMNKDDEDNGTRADDFKFWWHSHVNMSVFWSGTDENCIKEKLVHAPWWLSAVFNKKGEVKTRLDIKTPHMKLDNLKCSQNNAIPQHIQDFCKEEFKAKVKEVAHATYHYNSWQGKRGIVESRSSYYNGYEDTVYDYSRNFTGYQKPTLPSGIVQTHIPGLQTVNTIAPKVIIPSKESFLLPIPGKNGFIEARMSKAVDLYKDIYVRAVNFAEDSISLFSPTIELESSGKIFYVRRPETTTTGHIKCTITGEIAIDQYICFCWDDDKTIAYLGKVDAIFIGSAQEKTYTKSIHLAEGRFAEVILRLIPAMTWTDGKEESLKHSCGLIIKNKIRDLPEDFTGEQSDIYSYEDNIMDVDDESTSTESLIDQVANYAFKHEKDTDPYLYQRMEEWIVNGDRKFLLKFLDESENVIETADPNILASLIHRNMLDDNELINTCLEICLENPVEMFPVLWDAYPVVYYCPECFEPLAEETDPCQYCESEEE